MVDGAWWDDVDGEAEAQGPTQVLTDLGGDAGAVAFGGDHVLRFELDRDRGVGPAAAVDALPDVNLTKDGVFGRDVD